MVHLPTNSDHVTYYNKLQVDFKLTGKPSKPTPNGTETREWTHRLLKKYTFLQPRNVNAKTWHTGVWNKRLKALGNGTQAENNIEVIARSKFLLKMRKKGGGVSKEPSMDDSDFYSMEEDLGHHVREAL